MRETQFRIGSVTKMLTAAAVMQQVEAGTVFLDDRVTSHIPEVDFLGQWPAEVMTVGAPADPRHRDPGSQLQPQRPNRYPMRFRIGRCRSTMSGCTLPRAPSGTTRTRTSISPGWWWSGQAGSEYRSYMEIRVFGPAGMSRTTFDPAAVVAGGNFSYGHLDGRIRRRDSSTHPMTTTTAPTPRRAMRSPPRVISRAGLFCSPTAAAMCCRPSPRRPCRRSSRTWTPSRETAMATASSSNRSTI